MLASSDEPASQQPEQVRIVRDPGVPGLELVKADHSVRQWKVFNAVHSISISESWLGRVEYRGRASEVTPGTVFCTEPGEAHATSRPAAPGALRVLMIDETPLRDQLTELGFRGGNICFTAVVTRKAAAELRRLCSVMGAPGRTPLEVRSAFVDLTAAVARELLADGPTRPLPEDHASELADRMRDLLHASVEAGFSLSLDELAAVANLGRFRALRAFKRRHGIPPHTYELCLRLSRAQQLIKAGMSAATAAAHCGFADQSHMTRLFRSYRGYTPAQYAKDASARESVHRATRRSRR